MSKSHKFIELLNKSSECFNIFFKMSDVEKRRAILVACCLKNLYGFYASLKTFLNLLNNVKEIKKKQNDSKDYLSNHLKSSKKKGKRNFPRLWIQSVWISSWWDYFCAGQKVSERWK